MSINGVPEPGKSISQNHVNRRTVKGKSMSNPVDLYDSYPVPLPVKGNKVTPLIDGPAIFHCAEKMIKEAEESISIEMYDFSDMKMAKLLVDQAEKGIDVKVLLDSSQAEEGSEARKEVLEYLQSNEIPVVLYPTDQEGHRSDHCKLMIVDGKSVMVGGMNWNPLSKDNHDVMAKIDGPVANYYNAHFTEGWRICGGQTPLECLDPIKTQGDSVVAGFRTESSLDRSALAVVSDAIDNAEESVYMEMYVLSDDDIITKLINSHNKGVDVRVVLDPNSAKTPWNPNDGTFKKLKKAGVPVRWYKVKPGQRAHGKWMVVDKKKTLLGSVNYSHKGLNYNREIGAQIHDEKATNVFLKQFQYDWRYRASEEYPL